MKKFNRPIGEGKGNTMKTLLLAIIILLFSIPVQAATIRYDPVADTAEHKTKGYIIYYRFVDQTDWEEHVTPATEIKDFEKVLRLIQTETYDVAVGIYTTKGKRGPLSESKLFEYIQKKDPVILEVGGVKITVEETP